MKFCRLILVLGLLGPLLLQVIPPVKACGPFSIEPIFVFHESPDLPFREFAGGKIGIIQPTLGRKTLVIAYRYLNGGMFTDEEQSSLVEALDGKAPEEEGTEALKAWIAARQELLADNESLPEIYVDRKNRGYDYFPNCAKNAFEVATATLKDRVTSYGASDRGVKDWIAAQDTVFENCSGGSHIPAAANVGTPGWLRKDRDYQIAAAYFYSLNFEEARQRFARIADDMDSPWRETANYLVARTLVRQASLATDEKKKIELNSQAEVALANLSSTSGTFHTSARKLLALVQFRLHPEDRLQELAQTLTSFSGNENLRQDLIDYVWLLDQTEAKILEAEKKRQEELKPPKDRADRKEEVSPDVQARNDALNRGEIISIGLAPKTAEGAEDYRNYLSLDFNHDASENEVVTAFESKLNRKLTDEEVETLKDRRESALHYRAWNLSPNRKWGPDGMSAHDHCYNCGQLTLDLMPNVLRASDLTDWIMTLQTSDAAAYDHARQRWRDTSSRAWLAVALIKADKASPGRDRLMRDAESVGHDTPEYLTVMHELARLKIATGETDAARKLIDNVLANSAALPVSARNQFLEQRAHVSQGFSSFLKYSQRVPAAFYDPENGHVGHLADLWKRAKADWEPGWGETKQEWDHNMDIEYQSLLRWDQQTIFAGETVDVFNWYFPLAVLIEAARDPSTPDHLRRQLLLAAWTRAVLLLRHDEAIELTPDLIKAAPEMTSLLEDYLQAKPAERGHAALFVLLKFPGLSPYIANGLPSFDTSEELDYYFETSWWCVLPTTDYDYEGNEVAKKVARPDFLTPQQVQTAQRERKQLDALGAGKSYLGQQVLQWAHAAPNDSRLSEALFIAFKANESYKYGCTSWEQNQEIQQEAEALLRGRYAASGWSAKLPDSKDR